MVGRSARWFPSGLTLDDADQAVILDDGRPGPMFVMNGAEGLEAPPWNVTLNTTPGVGGASFNSAVWGVRTIRLPVYLSAPTRAEFRRIKSELISSINAGDGPGILVLSDGIGTKAGTRRCISAVYSDGLPGDEKAMSRTRDGLTWWEFTLELTGLGQWYSFDLLRASWRGRASTSFFPVRFPLTFSDSGVDVVDELVVTGDADTWPTYELYGPFSRLRISIDGRNSFVEVRRPLSSMEMLRIVTTPNEEELTSWVSMDGGKTFVPSPSPNALSVLDRDSWFEPLRARDHLTIDAVGTSSNTRVELYAKESWWSAS